MIGERRNFMPVDVRANNLAMKMLEATFINAAIGKKGDAFEVIPAFLSMITQELAVVLQM